MTTSYSHMSFKTWVRWRKKPLRFAHFSPQFRQCSKGNDKGPAKYASSTSELPYLSLPRHGTYSISMRLLKSARARAIFLLAVQTLWYWVSWKMKDEFAHRVLITLTTLVGPYPPGSPVTQPYYCQESPCHHLSGCPRKDNRLIYISIIRRVITWILEIMERLMPGSLVRLCGDPTATQLFKADPISHPAPWKATTQWMEQNAHPGGFSRCHRFDSPSRPHNDCKAHCPERHL